MKAISIEKFREHGAFRSVPDPIPGEGEALIGVRAAGVNPFDWIVRDGLAGDRAMPLVLGQDFAGVIERIGDKNSGFADGQRVFGITGRGSYAERTLVKLNGGGEIVAAIPDGIDDVRAAACVTPGLTALACLEALHIVAGDTLVIYGAAGSVGLIALQVAVARGVHVIALVKGAARDTVAFGAETIIDTNATDIVAGIQLASDERVDAVLDLVSSTHDEAIRFADVMRPGARLVSTKGAANIETYRKRGFEAVNIDLFATPQAKGASLEQLAAMIASGAIEVAVAREAPLADAADVLEDVKAGRVGGKAVLRVGPAS